LDLIETFLLTYLKNSIMLRPHDTICNPILLAVP
jgi:hypothetical protein